MYDSSAGSGTFVYVVDTGVLATHTQFGGRASVGYNAISGESATDVGDFSTFLKQHFSNFFCRVMDTERTLRVLLLAPLSVLQSLPVSLV